jgi:succinoglycan biosynthesis transport protein ExoP
MNQAPRADQPSLAYADLHPSAAMQTIYANRFESGSRAEESPRITDYLQIFRKHRSLIATITCATTILAALYCSITPALYTAETTIEMKGYAPLLSSSQSETLFGNDTRKIEYQKTTVAKLKLEGLADEVLSRDNLAEELEEYWDSRRSILNRFVSAITHPLGQHAAATSLKSKDPLFMLKPSVLHSYLDLIDITPIHETNLVTIQVTTAQPELSQKLANAHATGFIEHLQRERQEAISSNLQLLQRQAGDLKSRVTLAEQELSAYASANKIFSVSDSGAPTFSARQIESLSGLLAEATGRRIKTESLLAEVGNKKPDELSVTDDEITRQLRGNLQQTEAEYATLGSKVTAAHPAMQEIKAKIDSLKRSISEERRRAVKAIQTQFSNERSAEQRLRDQIDLEKASAQDLQKQLIQYNVLAKEASSLRDLYQAVLRQVKEIEISASSSSSHVFVTDYASLPNSPSAPKSNLIITLFAVLGVCLGLLTSLIMEAFDTTLKSSEDVQGALDLPFLGAIPVFGEAASIMPPQSPPRLSPPDGAEGGQSAIDIAEADLDQKAPHIVAVSAPLDIVSEALRTIRAGILLSSADNPPRIIMITSAMKGEGKTTVLYNLAATLAQASHRTIMIDGDLRERGLTKTFRQDPTPGGVGLSDLLTGQAQLDQVIRPTPVRGLDILPAGSKAPNPAELLSSTAMRDLISQLSDSYDFVLVDSPPILPVADGLTLSRIVDSVVLVVRSRKTERDLAQESRRRLLRVNARILGVVLNDLDLKADQKDALMYGGYAQDGESVIT